jgi:hypothetical protein
MREDGFMNSQTEIIAWQMINAYKYKIDFFHNLKENDYEDISKKEMCIRLIPMYFKAYKQRDASSKKEIKKMYFNYYSEIKNWKVLPTQEKWVIRVFHTSPGLVSFFETKVNLIKKMKNIRERK